MQEYPKYYFDIIQRSEEWYNLRSGRVTGSKAQAIGNCGKGLDTYIKSLISDHYSTSKSNNFCSNDMQHGIETESEAKCIFEFETGIQVKECGFIALDEFVGCSVDGLINDDGIIEIKCFSDSVYFDYLMTGKINSGHLWQCQMNLLVSGRKICKYIAYNGNFAHNLYIQDIFPDENKFIKLREGFKMSERLIKEYISKYENLVGSKK